MSEQPDPAALSRQRLARALAAADPSVAVPPGPDRPGGDPTDGGAAGGAAPPAAGMLARLAGSAFDPGRPGLRALVAVAVVVLVGVAALAWWSRPRPEPVLPQLNATPAVVASPTTPAELVVAVSGEVREPGLVELPAGSRVADAIEAAGGLLPDAEVDHLNLARKLVDGELVAVGIQLPPGQPGDPAAGSGSGPGGLVNLNTATAAELETLPGIGPALAQRIIDHRTTNGPFTEVGQLREVSGIGEVRFAELADRVTV